MAEWNDLLESIVETIADYRQGEVDWRGEEVTPTPARVKRWVKQFDDGVQILREMDHVLKKTYFSRARIQKFLAGLFQNEELVAGDPCKFWKGVKFLDIQKRGASQEKMRALFSKVLEEKCRFAVTDCGAEPHAYVYLDDASFTGKRIWHDLTNWIADSAPKKAPVHVIVIARHSGAYYYKNMVQAAAEEAKIGMEWWHAIKLEDRKKYTDDSDVLRPTTKIPEDGLVKAYVGKMVHKPCWRNPGHVGMHGIFASDSGRQILEQEFLKAGVLIRSRNPNLKEKHRPLGYSDLETLGFGSMLVTFSNCPNNAPLALWAGHPWYPLFPRRANPKPV